MRNSVYRGSKLWNTLQKSIRPYRYFTILRKQLLFHGRLSLLSDVSV